LSLKSNGLLNKESGKALADALKGNSILNELDISNNYDPYKSSSQDGSGFAQELAVGIRDNGALTHLDVSGNGLGQLVPPEGWEVYRDGKNYRQPGGDWSTTVPAGAQPLGLIALADAIPDMRALSRLVMRWNNIHGAEAGKAFADMLAQNTVLKELDLSSQACGPGGKALDAAFAKEFAAGISGNGAVSTLIFGGDGEVYDGSIWIPALPATLTVGMKEADFSNKNLQAAGAIIVAAWISHKDTGAISSVNLLKNHIPMEQAKTLASILKDHTTLKSLCGNSGEETELVMSGKKIGTEGAIMLAPEIAGNGALTSLNISDSNLGISDWMKPPKQDLEVGHLVDGKHIVEIRKTPVLSHTVRGDGDIKVQDLSGAIALADAIEDMRVMTSLNLASNSLGVKGAKIIAASLPKCT
jgi:hypothetical protein